MITAQIIQELKELTDCNAHTEAYILGAETLGLEEIVDQLQAIDSVSQNSISQFNYEYRYMLYQQMVEAAKTLLSPSQFNEFYMCF